MLVRVQAGQSWQPSPDPVSLTAPPLTMPTANATTANPPAAREVLGSANLAQKRPPAPCSDRSPLPLGPLETVAVGPTRFGPTGFGPTGFGSTRAGPAVDGLCGVRPVGVGPLNMRADAIPVRGSGRANIVTVASSARTLALPTRTGAWGRVSAYVSLTKPRIVELLLVTTVPTMIVAAGGWPPLRTVLATVAGGTLAAGGANAANMYIDRDIDALMSRTAHRPLVTGQVSATGALAFSAGLEVGAFALLWTMVNQLSALLTLGAALFYVLVYTLLLKRSSSQNIVIGGAAGAVPVLVGWAAVTGRLAWAPAALFALVFLWTPPHFWALAIRYRDDYATARVPMMPVVETAKHTASQVLVYAVATVGASCLFGVLAHMQLAYWSVAAASGLVLVLLAVKLLRSSTPDVGAGTSAVAMKLFHWSITYLSLLFVAMALDVLVH